MAFIKHIFPYLIRVYKRGVKARSIDRLQRAICAWIALVLVLRYFANCYFVFLKIKTGDLFIAINLYEFNLHFLFLIWLVLPFLLSIISQQDYEIKPQAMLQFPLTKKILLFIGILNIITRPFFSVLAIISILGLFPLLFIPNAFTAIIAGLLFLFACICFSFAIVVLGSQLNVNRMVRELGRMLLPVYLILILFMNLYYTIIDNNLYVYILNYRILLLDKSQTAGMLTYLNYWSPASWVKHIIFDNYTWLWFLPFLIMIISILGLSIGTFLNRLVTSPEVSQRQVKKQKSWVIIPLLATDFNSMIQQTIHYSTSAKDYFLGIILSLFFTANIIIYREVSILALFFFFTITFLINTVTVFNIFGLDASGFCRYLQLPIERKKLLIAKNTSYLFIMLLQLIPILGGVLYKFDILMVCQFLLSSLIALLLYLSWGNISSILMPAKRYFTAFTSNEQAGGIISMIFAFGVWILLFYFESLSSIIGNLGLLFIKLGIILALFFIYYRLLMLAAQLLEKYKEKISNILCL